MRRRDGPKEGLPVQPAGYVPTVNSAPDGRPLSAYRFWWLYVLLALGNFALAVRWAVDHDRAWGVNVGIWTVLGLCFLGMGLVFRHQGRKRSATRPDNARED